MSETASTVDGEQLLDGSDHVETDGSEEITEEEIEADHSDLLDRLRSSETVEDREQEIGTLRKMLDEEDLDEIPRNEILETTGLLSHVLDGEEVLGHILMIEWDDITDVFRPIRTAERLPGISVLLESSPGSYHLYNLSVRPIEEQLLDAMRKDGDVWQARWAARREYFVLRVVGKIRSESREVYKPAPEPLKVFASESEFPQSAPHLDILLDLAEEQGVEEVATDLRALREDRDLVGNGLRADHYQTVTDGAKEVLGK